MTETVSGATFCLDESAPVTVTTRNSCPCSRETKRSDNAPCIPKLHLLTVLTKRYFRYGTSKSTALPQACPSMETEPRACVILPILLTGPSEAWPSHPARTSILPGFLHQTLAGSLSVALHVRAPDTTATTNKRKRRMTVSDACTSCRRSKVKCEEQRPSLRCIKHDWQDSCVSWSVVKAARTQDSGDQSDETPPSDPVATADKAKPCRHKAKPCDASRENTKQMLSCTTLIEASTDWSNDEDDDFSKVLEFLKAYPVPRDHPPAQGAAEFNV